MYDLVGCLLLIMAVGATPSAARPAGPPFQGVARAEEISAGPANGGHLRARTSPSAPRVGDTLPTPTCSAALRSGPALTPLSLAPRLLDPGAAGRAVRSGFPDDLRKPGVTGTSHLWFLIGRTGAVEQVRVARSSGHARLDEAAASIGRGFRFHPGMLRGDTVCVWLQLPIRFDGR
jgi:protein TonB